MSLFYTCEFKILMSSKLLRQMEKGLFVVVVALRANVVIHRVFAMKCDLTWDNLAILQVDLVSTNNKGNVACNSLDGRIPFVKVLVGLLILHVEEEN